MEFARKKSFRGDEAIEVFAATDRRVRKSVGPQSTGDTE
jgi:hypothetical protein